MLTHKGFSAWITVGDIPLNEYLVAEDPAAARVSCWIPSEPGTNFKVHWKDHGGTVETAAFIVLDGLTVPGRFLKGQGETSREGVRTGANTERPFTFQEVFADEPSSNAANKEVGMIVLKIKRVQCVAGRPANPVQAIEGKPGRRRVGDVCAGFGEERPTYEQFPHTWVVRPLAEDDPTGKVSKPSTYVSFVFRYRTRDWLQSQSIMPEFEPAVASYASPSTGSSHSASTPASEPPPSVLMTPRESPDPTPPKKKVRGVEKPGLSGKAMSPMGRARKSPNMRRTVSYQSTPASRQASMEHVFHFELPTKDEDDDDKDPDWRP
ncbi:hypothetical protein HMN09_00091800 [Mycena chlorophos]|uniref:DUF7918 domain-containing protein n=1 Tax=Mycena chlorophos TaxID=658473 RepID=A0A8H6WMX2_MYCCL|nr:hypothetical protein HMN09_00091800 [Mycena chlorophos]